MDLRISLITFTKRFVSFFKFVFRTRCRQSGATCSSEFVFCPDTLLDGGYMFAIESINYLFNATVFFSGSYPFAASQGLIAFFLEA
jgi:hypothetical protein